MQIIERLKVDFQKAKEAFLKAEKICIISHRGPDGDAVGANSALRLALESMGKKVVSASVDPVPENSIWLKKADTFVQDFNYSDFDLICAVDCAAPKLVAFNETKKNLFDGPLPFVNIDHHESNNGFGDINIVDGDSCSTCIMLYHFFNFCGWKISMDMATSLLHGIYFDTGSLMHSNTTVDVYEIAGRLVSKGANLKMISKKLFKTTDVKKMRLWGRILERAYINDEGVTVSAVSEADYEATGASSKDTGGAIDYLNAVPGSKYCVLLSEDREKGIVKGSLRTQRDDVNLSEVAGKWGGGGHPKASGFGVEGSLKPVMAWQIIDEEGKGKDLSF